MAGRRRKPSGAVRRNGQVVQPATKDKLTELPEPPEEFDDIERSAWERYGGQLARVRQICETDLGSLELLCIAWADLQSARASIRQHGRTYEAEGRNGSRYPVARPEVGQASDAAKRLRSLLVELGMTPASRGRVERSTTTATEEEEVDPFDAIDAMGRTDVD